MDKNDRKVLEKTNLQEKNSVQKPEVRAGSALNSGAANAGVASAGAASGDTALGSSLGAESGDAARGSNFGAAGGDAARGSGLGDVDGISSRDSSLRNSDGGGSIHGDLDGALSSSSSSSSSGSFRGGEAPEPCRSESESAAEVAGDQKNLGDGTQDEKSWQQVFEAQKSAAANAAQKQADALLLNIDGYEGPIEILLDLARSQKVDLMHVSILGLARQYLSFIERAKELRLDLAAEYLVMATWLAYLKSKLLLPKTEEDDEPSAEEIAEALQFQLRRLEAMQQMAETLMERPQLGQGLYARGMPEGLKSTTKTSWDVDLYEILKAYGDIRRRQNEQHYDLPEFHLMSTETAMQRLQKMLGNLPRKGGGSVWTTLQSFLPESSKDKLYARSSMASTFTASLELAKAGGLEIKQDGLFRTIYVRQIHIEHDMSADTASENA